MNGRELVISRQPTVGGLWQGRVWRRRTSAFLGRLEEDAGRTERTVAEPAEGALPEALVRGG